MVVIAVLSILVVVAYPNYQSQMLKNRRSDGQRTLLEIMNMQQKYYSRNSAYTANLVADLGLVDAGGGDVASEKEFYLISAQACPTLTINQCVVLTATPQGGQVGDGNLTYNSRNEKTPASKW